ncbi:MAG TPA: cupin domain-containing protein [Kiloniellaceae bacterium]
MPTEKIPPSRPIASSDIPWTEWSDVPRFAVRYRHLSLAALGDSYRVGVAIEELPPGKQSSPAHWHVFEEEHLFLLEGRLTLRIGAETHVMTAGDYACFPAGQQAGHCLVNDSDALARYVIVGEHNPNEVTIYTDSSKVLVRALGRRALFDLAALRDYWDGEDTGLPPGEAPPPDAAHSGHDAPAKPFPPIASRDLAWDEWQLGRGFVDRNKHLTRTAVGEDYRVGILIEGPPPGMRCAPRHYHLLEEEHALVLEGEVTLLLGDERHVMKSGDYVCFPAGQKIGHSFVNSGDGPCSYLMIGEHNPHDVCVLPDSNKMVVRALGRERAIFDMAGVRNYLDGET